jgi:hypothetical protein
VQKVSGDSRHNQEAKFSNRTIRVTDEGIQIMGDEKHAQTLLREWGMGNCKGLDNPVGAKVKDVLEEKIPMDPDDAWKYRRGTARVNYMAQDRPDLGVAAKMLSQSMADPQMGDEVPLKRVIRYLKGFPVCISNLYFQDAKPPLVIMSDSDWAGDEETRKSTCGGLVRYGGHLVQNSGDSGPVPWRSGTQRNREKMQQRNRGVRVAARSWVQPQDFLVRNGFERCARDGPPRWSW